MTININININIINNNNNNDNDKNNNIKGLHKVIIEVSSYMKSESI